MTALDANTDDTVRCEIDGSVATVILHRPERNNAWTSAMERRYLEVLLDLEHRPDIAVAVVTGAGRSFCPGLDAEDLANASHDADSTDGGRSIETVLRLGLPLICAINGACAGIGLLQALACDVRFVAASAKITTAFSRRGTIAELATAWLLPRIVGHAVALDLLLSGRVIDGAEAAALGLANRSCADARVLEEAQAYAHDVAAHCSPRAMATIKRQVYDAWMQTVGETEREAQREMYAPGRAEDFREGVASFLERRPPAFAGFAGFDGVATSRRRERD